MRLCDAADGKQLMLTAPTVHCTLPFCIAQCSVHLVGLVVVVRDLVLDCDDAEGRGTSLCTTLPLLLGKMVHLYNYTKELY